MGKFKKIPRGRHLNFGTIVLIIIWCFLTLIIAWPLSLGLISSNPDLSKPKPGGVNYLVIAPQTMGEIATAWSDYRKSTGYQSQLVLLPADQLKPDLIREMIQNKYEESGNPYPFYVLLIGHAHPDSSNPDAYLPAATFSIDPNQFLYYGTDPIPSDDGFIGETINGIPRNTLPIFIGRIPARNNEEAFRLLIRTQDYEENPPAGDDRGRIELVSSNPGFDPSYEPIFDWMLKTLVQKILPEEYKWHMLNGDSDSPYNYPVELFPREVAKRLDSGALAMVYIGHGQPEMIAWATASDGSRGQIFGFEDAGLIQNANSSLGIFTACSAGDYDLSGDDLSVVEAMYLTPAGPVATYSSSAFINGTLNGRLVVDLTEALLVHKATTIGEWMSLIETDSHSVISQSILATVVKAVIPRISGLEKYSWISSAKARQTLDIQHATYNLFGDPALRIAYPQEEIKVHPSLIWQPWKGWLFFFGHTSLPAGQQVSVSLERIPGSASTQADQSNDIINRYLQANDQIIGMADAYTQRGGDFSGRIAIPSDLTSGKYILRAISTDKNTTQISAHPIYIGWPPIIEIISSAFFWWIVIGILILFIFLKGTKSRSALPK